MIKVEVEKGRRNYLDEISHDRFAEMFKQFLDGDKGWLKEVADWYRWDGLIDETIVYISRDIESVFDRMSKLGFVQSDQPCIYVSERVTGLIVPSPEHLVIRRPYGEADVVRGVWPPEVSVAKASMSVDIFIGPRHDMETR